MEKKTIKLTESQFKQIVKESVKKIISEAFSDIYEPNHIMANNNQVFDGYVIIDNSDYSNNGYFENKIDAIEEAEKFASMNKYGSYSVVGCIGDSYDLDDESSIIYIARNN